MPRLPLLALAALCSACLPSPVLVRVEVSPEDPITIDDLVFEVVVEGAARELTLTLQRDEPPLQRPVLPDELVAVEEREDFVRYRLVIPAAETVRDQTWTLRAVAARGRATATAEGVLAVQNSPPTVSLVLVPEEPTAFDTLRAVAVAEDLDGDPTELVYRWFVGEQGIFTFEAELEPGVFGRGDRVEARVFARDDAASSGLVVAGVTIGNLEPGPAQYAVNPGIASSNVPLRCEVIEPSVDPDGDPITYRFAWLVDGAPYDGPLVDVGWPGDTVSATATTAGQRWTCLGTPSDGFDDGPTREATAEVLAWEGARRFTTCGAVGEQGPSAEQCAAAYQDGTLADEIALDQGIQRWTPPMTALVRIEAGGARGGHSDPTQGGAPGALAATTVLVEQGQTIAILVGQAGEDSMFGSAGGGGGTFVARFREGAWEPVLVAGGGGGSGGTPEQNGCPGRSGRHGGEGTRLEFFSPCAEKGDDLAQGGRATFDGRGAGGGGFSGSGHDDLVFGREVGHGGASFTAGGAGGQSVHWACPTEPANGGFGGGGAGQGCPGGGGGGGYSGGDGGRLAGGGGSIAVGQDAVTEAGGNPEPDGWVVIELATLPED